MLCLETPVDSRQSMPTTDAGEDFMAAGCVEVAGAQVSQVCSPSGRQRAEQNFPEAIVHLAKQIIAGD